ncbi:ABC transporter ATP-binding protein [Devosia yakushimensis]|uniref:ABC transporter ATP-binding protein n=1 Tax=Devosia yakushimensis TaxID=470028 RepID=A0ABQ5UBU6_9HYPH|nr:ABC transporter ATP-binding protein [Devosia yakushimensis]GLQ08787.1 ABC transporter ATP-binding protein [Devosia yakushimensis]
MTIITLDAVSKQFGSNFAVRDVSVTLPKGSFTALLGPSGCGKTTLLRLIAGFEQPTSGTIQFDTRLMAGPTLSVAPEKRDLGIVFQSYALWPHMDVAANVAYPLRARGIGRAEIEQRVARALDMVSLAGFEQRSVDALSGGQRQRVALARCLVTGTDIILLDEPLANLDVHLRAAMLDIFADIHRRTGATIVFVTHDQSEALALADRIVMLDHGQVQQTGTPQQLYAEPANATVAGFIGRGSILAAQAATDGTLLAGRPINARGTGKGPVQVLVRPEAVRLGDTGIAGQVARCRYTGASYETVLTLASGETLMLDTPNRLDIGAAIHLTINDAWIIPG